MRASDFAAMGFLEVSPGVFAKPGKGLPAKAYQGGVEREADLHDQILSYCRAKGFPAVHSRMDRPATCGVGTPDFVIAIPNGGTVWVEAKTRTGKLTPEQHAWMAALQRHGHRCAVVRSFAEFLEVLHPA